MNKKYLAILATLFSLILLAVVSYSFSLSKEEKTLSFIIENVNQKWDYLHFDFKPFSLRQKVFLFSEDILTETNLHRKNLGFEELESNLVLKELASARARDMFSGQYFAHNSPTGSNAELEAQKLGYQFLTIAENIALGNFENSKALVEAWMNSPEHRKNILGTDFTEIGIAAEKGVFEGKETWIAVQIFARPLSDCPTPNNSLKTIIEQKKSHLESLKTNIQTLHQQMEVQKSQGNHESYNQNVGPYNELVRQANQLQSELQNLINSYNTQVNSFNFCLNS